MVQQIDGTALVVWYVVPLPYNSVDHWVYKMISKCVFQIVAQAV